MQHGPAVSVVVPLFEKARTVGRAVGSVLAQSMPDLELMVIDDGSTDGGGERAAVSGDPRLRVLRQANAGVSAARNRGIAEARAPLVAFLDADDAWDAGFLETVLALHAAHPAAGCFASGYRMRDPEGYERLPALRRMPAAPGGGLLDDFFACIERDSPLISSNVMIPRHVFETVGGFPEGEVLGEDWDMWARIALAYPIAFDPAVRVTYHLEAANRAMNRLAADAGYGCLIRTLRNAIATERFDHVARAPLANLLCRYLLYSAHGPLRRREAARALAIVDEARRYGVDGDDFARHVLHLSLIAGDAGDEATAGALVREARRMSVNRLAFVVDLANLARRYNARGRGRHARALLRDARDLYTSTRAAEPAAPRGPADRVHWRRIRWQSYLGRPINALLEDARRIETTLRRRRRARPRGLTQRVDAPRTRH